MIKICGTVSPTATRLWLCNSLRIYVLTLSNLAKFVGFWGNLSYLIWHVGKVKSSYVIFDNRTEKISIVLKNVTILFWGIMTFYFKFISIHDDCMNCEEDSYCKWYCKPYFKVFLNIILEKKEQNTNCISLLYGNSFTTNEHIVWRIQRRSECYFWGILTSAYCISKF